ncbi:MAG: UDP-glucose 6-dehydrogenase [Nitrospirae bacterium GWF2_44_13]|nr:MAG: UDP-glucose 6-dehydrogenase [Nitrospirae bacterium GWF2_44_13]OGW33311.1 MAG: UDP-glucose 6-dehydrogenase [Nitrospirae bacterium GWD2_44_7]OGW64765.1 MAG: UDP-glucose 6-dehydrogenase [Nitrospirae bacterium RIFOXYA2_FULL_44_9]HBG92126.1 UDP-glucose 6-dehydrogenase [Nitrospiraceae bacterium]
MRISIIGTGYVGLVTGACMAQMGNSVFCVDVDRKKIDNLKRGVIPIYEPGLEPLVAENYRAGTLRFTTDIKEAIDNSEICCIAVGTPMGEDGSADLQHVLQAASDIGKNMTHHIIIVNKSTVPVGTADKVRDVVKSELNKRKLEIPFDVVSNPEFLKEGAAVEDFMRPDRVIAGADNPKALEKIKELYAPFTRSHERFISMDVRSAEMTKYAANAMLAAKVSFINEIANICERVGADVNKVRVGIGSDSRIGYSFIYPGCGYGGSCFPKDVRALERLATENKYAARMLRAVQEINESQKLVLVRKVIKRFGEDLNGHVFAVWGLSFKPETDDTREASSIAIIRELTKHGAKIKAYDPRAMDVAKAYYLKDLKNVEYADSKYTALSGADALLLVTEWKEFRSPDFDEIARRLKNKIIFDGRNQYNKEKLNEIGFEYFQIGVGE